MCQDHRLAEIAGEAGVVAGAPPAGTAEPRCGFDPSDILGLTQLPDQEAFVLALL